MPTSAFTHHSRLCQRGRRLLSLLSLTGLLLGATSFTHAQSPVPAAWWTESNLLTSATPDENGLVINGQLKNVVWNVARRLDYRFTAQGGCGDELRPIMRSWDWRFPASATTAFHVPQIATDRKNKSLVNQGQLKNMAHLVYKRLKALGQPIVLKGREPTTGALTDVIVDPDVSDTLPWGSGENTAPARIGHLKYLFSFELDTRSPVVAWGSNAFGQHHVPGGLESTTAIAAGAHHNLALKADGTIVAWGNNDQDQCLVPAWLNDATAVAAGVTHSLALRQDGTVVSWGNVHFSGGGAPAGLNQVVAIAAADNHSLALKSDGTVVIWGNPNTPGLTVPAGLTGVTAIATGDYHHLALRSDGTVVAWGSNTWGQTTVPADLTGVIAIAAGKSHSVALKRDGTVVVWGGALSNKPFLVPPAGLNNVVAIAAGGHVMALQSDGTAVAWGFEGIPDPANPGFRLVPPGLTHVIAIAAGTAHSVALTGQEPVFTSSAFFSFSADDSFTGEFYRSTVSNAPGAAFTATGLPPGLSINADTGIVVGTPLAGGTWTATLTATTPASFVDHDVTFRLTDLLPQIQEPLFESAPVFQAYSRPLIMRYAASTVVTGLPPGLAYDPGTQIISGTPTQAGTFAVTATGTSQLGTQASQFQFSVHNLTAWGENGNGETTLPQGLGKVTAIDSGTSFSLALTSSGTVVGWGRNLNGATTVPAGLTGEVFTAVAAGNNHGLALKSDGTIAAWGSNEYGKGSVPLGQANIVAIAAANNHSVVLRNDGRVVAWGQTSSAQYVPHALRDVVAIAAGGTTGAALRNDGTVANWTLGNYFYNSVPTEVEEGRFVAIAAGPSHRLALLGNGTVVAWGSNAFGQLDMPAGLTGVVAIEAGTTHSVALKNDGTVVTWGLIAAPVPAGLDRVVAIGAGAGFTLAMQAPDATTPVFISPPRSTGAENRSSTTGIYYRSHVVNGPATYTATSLPPGLVLDPATGIVSGTPTSPHISYYPPDWPAGYADTVTVTVPATITATTSTGTATQVVKFHYTAR